MTLIFTTSETTVIIVVFSSTGVLGETLTLARSCENVYTVIPRLWATALQGTAGYFKTLFHFFQFMCIILSNG